MSELEVSQFRDIQIDIYLLICLRIVTFTYFVLYNKTEDAFFIN